jgi:hypothetical protein
MDSSAVALGSQHPEEIDSTHWTDHNLSILQALKCRPR